MKPTAVSMAAVLMLLGALSSGCVAEIESGDQRPIEVTQAATAQTDGACLGGYLGECRDGNKSMCKRYSERCDVRIGVIGDSLTDEYQGVVSALPGQTWSEQVQADPRISLGVHEANPSVRGEPRNDGYSLNWARFGQAATSIQWNQLTNDERVPISLRTDPRLQTIGSFDAQISGLSAQIAAGEVDVALVWVGHNDLFIRTYIGYEQDGGQSAFFGALIGRIVGAAAALRNAASADPGDIKAKVAIVGLAGAASALNPSLSAAAASAGITFIDSFNTAVSAIVNEQATTGFYDVGGTPLQPFTIVYAPFSATPKTASLSDLAFPGTGPCGFNPATNSIGCATPAYAEPFRHYDAVHPNTLYMGVVGNQILTHVNATWGFAMRTISESQLLDTAGL